MDKTKYLSRRNFIKHTSLGLSAGIAATGITSFVNVNPAESAKSLASLSVVTLDMRDLLSADSESRVKRILRRMGELVGLKPDIVCLPELFTTIRKKGDINVRQIAEDEKTPGPVTSQIAEFAAANNCYVACPVYTKNNGRLYNSSILIDRKGIIKGVYHKIHPSSKEISLGISAGALNQPLIQAEFGKIGMQIGEDVFWSEGWDNLKASGANIILYSSDLSGGRMLNHYALRNNCYILSGTVSDGRIIDISGNDLHSSSTFIRYVWENINMEKMNMSSLPSDGLLSKIFNKYGNKIEIRVWDFNWVATIESHDPNLKVKDLMHEFEIESMEEFYKRSEEVQKKYRL